LDGKEGKWITLLDFVWNHRDKNAINLFFSLLKLYCDLCEDRNVACISIITAQLNLTFNVRINSGLRSVTNSTDFFFVVFFLGK
jgi:hypothetical protein